MSPRYYSVGTITEAHTCRDGIRDLGFCDKQAVLTLGSTQTRTPTKRYAQDREGLVTGGVQTRQCRLLDDTHKIL